LILENKGAFARLANEKRLVHIVFCSIFALQNFNE